MSALAPSHPLLPPPALPPSSPEQKFNLWWVGVFIMLLGTVTQACGANVQRLSARREEENNPHDTKARRPARKQPLVWLGMGMWVGGGIISSLALVFAAQSLLSPLILVIFFSNPLFAYLLNGERFRWATDGTCTALIATAVGLIIAYAPHHSASYDAAHLKWLFTQPPFVAFALMVSALIFTAWYVKRQIFLRCERDWANLTSLRDRAIVHISYGALGGTFGGVNITLTKATFTIIVDQFESGRDDCGVACGVRDLFTSWFLYLVAFSLLVTFFFELKCTSDGLQAASAIVVVSTLSVTEKVSATLGAMLYFQDYHAFTTTGAIVFIIGSVVGLSLVIFMSVLRLRAEAAEEAASDEGATLRRGKSSGGEEKEGVAMRCAPSTMVDAASATTGETACEAEDTPALADAQQVQVEIISQ